MKVCLCHSLHALGALAWDISHAGLGYSSLRGMMYMGGVQGSGLLAAGEREPKRFTVNSCRCTVPHACLKTDSDVLYFDY